MAHAWSKRDTKGNRNLRPPSPATRRVMQANRGQDTGPELALRRALWAHGLRGYRIHPSTIPGRPDVCYPRLRVAVFVHGCFWHACPTCDLKNPASNVAFWVDKFARNQARDARQVGELARLGWRVVIVWEHEVKADLSACVERVAEALGERKTPRSTAEGSSPRASRRAPSGQQETGRSDRWMSL